MAAYQFIVSGYPAVNESRSAASDAISLKSAMRSGKSTVSALEARYRTWDESNASELLSDKFRSLLLFIK